MGPGFRPVFLRSATSRTRCWLLPKGSKIPPPQGQNSYFLLRSPNLAKPGADQCLDPPALLAVTATPLAFGMIGDFPLRIAEEIPIPVFFQMFTSSLVFQGGLPPCFSAVFRPVSGFSEAGGILTLPQRKKRHTGATAAFAVFSQWWCVLF